MFGNTARSLPRVHSYADAEKVFNQRGAVRSKKWAEHERPLYKTYYHYRGSEVLKPLRHRSVQHSYGKVLRTDND